MRFLTAIDLGQNELQSAVIHNLPTASFPTGVAGQVAFDSTTSELKFHNGTGWQIISTAAVTVNSVTAGGGISVTGTANNPIVSHEDTSTAANLTASSRTYVTALTFDTYGHVTGYATGTETVVNTNTTYDLTVPTGTTAIRLAGSDSTNDDVTLTAGSNVTITRVSATEISIASTDTNTTYSAGTGLALVGTTFSLSHLGLQSLTDPNADRIFFWDDSAGTSAWLSLGTNLAISGTTLNATNNYVTGVTFNTADGVLTFTRSGLANLTVDLDGRYLQSYTEVDTLDSVTGRGATTANAITVGGLTVNGNLTVSGAVTTKISEIVQVEDALIVLNSNETGAPTNDAGFVVERGTSANEMFVWDESADEWIVASTTETGSTAGNAVVTSYSKMHVGVFQADGVVFLPNVSAATVAPTGFLSLSDVNEVEYRTPAQVLSDIGAQPSGSYVTTINTAGNTGTGTLVNNDTLSIQGTGLVSVALVGDTFTVSTTANNYVHPTQTAITQDNSGFTFIQDISVNTLGHVTSVATGTVTAATESATGVVELATTAEANTGTDTSRAVTPAGVKAAIVGRQHVATIGDGTSTSIAVTHNLNTRDVIVQLYDVSTFDTVYANVTRNTTNQVTIVFGSAPALNDIRVMIQAVGI